MTQKVPPPPDFSRKDPVFNRWLLELTSILNSDGSVTSGSVDGLDQLQADVATNTTAIQTLQNGQSGNAGAIGDLQNQVNSLTTRVTNLEANVSALTSRNQVYNSTIAPVNTFGIDNDWWYNTTGAAGARLYIKKAGAWVAQAI